MGRVGVNASAHIRFSLFLPPPPALWKGMRIAADNIAKLTLLPLLIAQGLWLRRTARLLPEPEGPRNGTQGVGAPLRLLILGDSAAAGVGAGQQDEALSGQLVSLLAQGYRVIWHLEAHTGETTASTLARLRLIEPAPFDIAVTSLGVNDVTHGVTLNRWLRDTGALHHLLRGKFGVNTILASGVPPMHHFPLLPQPLRWVLGQTAARFDGALADMLEETGQATHLPFDLPFSKDMMAIDGFHPTPAAYRLWAARIAQRIPK